MMVLMRVMRARICWWSCRALGSPGPVWLGTEREASYSSCSMLVCIYSWLTSIGVHYYYRFAVSSGGGGCVVHNSTGNTIIIMIKGHSLRRAVICWYALLLRSKSGVLCPARPTRTLA